jgi:hypothetical protein
MRETSRARQAWADYLALGEGRSLEKLAADYVSRSGSGPDPDRETGPAPPTRFLSTLKEWSARFGWQERLRAIADAAAADAQAAIAARRREVLEDGLGLDYERVTVLKRVAERLRTEIEEEGRLWVQDAKSIGSGESAERVDIERFNAAEVEQLRGLLDDIAKEKGERVKRLEHSGRDGAPIAIREIVIEMPAEKADD